MTIEDLDRSIAHTASQACKAGLPAWAVTGILRMHADGISLAHHQSQMAMAMQAAAKKQASGIVGPGGVPVPPSGQ